MTSVLQDEEDLALLALYQLWGDRRQLRVDLRHILGHEVYMELVLELAAGRVNCGC